MDAATLQLMHDHVRAIYRAITGGDLPEPAEGGATQAPPADLDTRFARLEALARSVPGIAGRVAPFSFTPPLDVIETERELVLELALPGIDRKDVRVDQQGDALLVSGMRPADRGGEGRIYHHAEIPRGVFHRIIPLPYAVGEPRVEAEHGLLRIRLPRRIKAAPAQA